MTLPSTTDPHDLGETGWGILYSQDEAPEILVALRPLLQRRREQAGKRYRELAYQPGESARRFLWLRHGESPGVLDPDVLPYYLLIVGGPEAISFGFQYQLAINHAVGRIAFDAPAGYRRYADAVLLAEDRGVELPRRATIVSGVTEGEPAALLSRRLVTPLSEGLSGLAGWEVEVRSGDRARKRDLLELLGGSATPGLLIASCHGLRKQPGTTRQANRQGALVCRDWAGGGRPPTFAEVLGEEDLAEELPGLQGLIAYLFADFSAGTPVEDDFRHELTGGLALDAPPRRRKFAHRPFVTRLSQGLLSRGGLAVVGYVGPSWSTPVQLEFERVSSEATRTIQDSLRELLAGSRIGHSLRPLVRRYVSLAGELAECMERLRNGERIDEASVTLLWTAHNEARNLVLLGDPAVYLLGQRSWPAEAGQEGEASWPAEAGQEGEPGWVRLSTENLDHAREQAALARVDIEAWVNRALVEHREAARHATREAEVVPLDSRIPVAPGSPPRVFLSYASEDRAIAQEIREQLRVHAIEIWDYADPEQGIGVGHRVGAGLEHQIRTSDFFILCLSLHSVRKHGHVQREWNIALRHQDNFPHGDTFVVPIQLNDCELPDSIVAYDLNCLRLSDDLEQREGQLDRLAQQVLRESGQRSSKG